MTEPARALEGVKVVDFATAMAGPFATHYLASHGAVVIKVESIHAPNVHRVSAPFKDNISGPDRALLFAKQEANKYGITINLNHPRGPEVAWKLIEWADVVVEGYAPGLMKRWGLDYEHLAQRIPGIVMLSTSNQGQTGPHATLPGWGYQMAALAGFVNLTGWPDREAVGIPSAYTDYISPWLAVAVVVAALDYRRKTGQGQFIDSSQLEAALNFMSPAHLDYSANGREQKRVGNRSKSSVPHGSYRCRGDDQWCAISVSDDNEWEAFCRTLGSPAWTRDPRFGNLLGRKHNEDELERLVEEWTLTLNPLEVMSLLQSNGVAAGVVQSIENVYSDPHIEHRGYLADSYLMSHPVIGPCRSMAVAFRLSKTPHQMRMPSPCLGEHNEYVLTKILGMSDEEFVGLLNEGVLE